MAATSHPAPVRLHWAAAALLACLAVAAYLPALNAGFVNIDDGVFIVENKTIHQGVTTQTLAWCFDFEPPTGWTPVAWMSYLVDYELFGLNPRGYHAVNVLLHAVNAALLFALLVSITGRSLPALLVGALFAVHPQHVESVAWIAERRDVLFMCFGLLTLIAYHRYAQRPTVKRYLLVFALYAMGLMSKPALVTLPVLMLLLDVWPLKRDVTLKCIAEKLPLLCMAAGAAAMTMMMQRDMGAMSGLTDMPLSIRLANVPVALASYLYRAINPTGLCFFYPHPGYPTVGELVGATLVLAAAAALAWRTRRSQPWIAVGLLWFVMALLPMIGIVQVGAQRTADRYTYLPMIGIYIAAIWSLAALRPSRKVATMAALAALMALTALTWRQAGYWQSSLQLCRRALAVTEDNYVAHNNLGTLYSAKPDTASREQALHHFQEAARLRPGYALAHRNIGSTLIKLDRPREAIEPLVRATQLATRDHQAHFHLAVALERTGNLQGAIECMRWAHQCAPDNELIRSAMKRLEAKQP